MKGVFSNQLPIKTQLIHQKEAEQKLGVVNGGCVFWMEHLQTSSQSKKHLCTKKEEEQKVGVVTPF